ncbi:MAG: hypothetical protein M3295_02870 [Chloroflexota bacterium]|nr:hypothetical protein [Chloroflexota bacterium]
MDERDDLLDKPFDPEMTEDDEANAPDDTGPTAADPETKPGREEIGV